MKKYIKRGTKFKNKYGKTLTELEKEFGITSSSFCNWDKKGFDIFFMAEKQIIKRERIKKIHSNGGQFAYSKITQLWKNLISRCGNPKDKKYKYYGGKGIKLILTKDDLIYLWIRDNAKNMKKPSIDRIDSQQNYRIENCHFIEMSENIKKRWEIK